ncbi:MAG: type II toxin-antitoxin system VapC family toxin [Pirellulales bacterium]|nr:type II toxin-antitoxin system VapC family toxin [Pirellulales bacterium]
MSYLLDTGLLLRIIDRKDSQHDIVIEAVRRLIARRAALFIATQTVAEFCNVAMRPIASNGLGLPPFQAVRLLELEIEPQCSVLPEVDGALGLLKRLVATYGVSGKQVHDARLAAIVLAWKVEAILTLNDRDFRRFALEGIQIETPATIIAGSQ